MKASRRSFILGAGSGLLLGTKPTLAVGPSATAIEKPLALGADPALAGPVVAGPAATAAPQLWDGGSGATSLYYNVGALLPWRKKGGDYVDATGTLYGTTPYGTLTWSALGPAQADITPLVNDWYADGNTGAYILGGGEGVVGSRSNTDPAKRPVLLLTNAAGTVTTVPCLASAACDVNSEGAVTGTAITLGKGKNLLLQFDLPMPKPAFVSAKLQLVKTYAYSAPLAVKIFDILPPFVFDGAAATPQLGIAQRYVADAGIESDPNVYFQVGFDESNYLSDLFPSGDGWISPNATVSVDAELGIPALHTQYNVGSLTASSLNHKWSTKRYYFRTRNPANNLLVRAETPAAQYIPSANADCPNELFFRYYLKLKQGFHCPIEGKKLPGLAGRFGNWSGDDHFGYYVAQSGNGGAPTSGAYNGKTLNGWSMRHHAYAAPKDANPLRNLIPLNYYAYFVGMVGYFGNYWRWGDATKGYVNVAMDEWYCLEHQVKMNTVTGPFDANGNGVPKADGIVRGWLDGVLVFERTDVILRKHPAIKIDEVWLDHYHGGTVPAETTHPFAMAGLVVARQYIGPINRGATAPIPPVTGTTPAWLAGKAVNQWIPVPGTALSETPDIATQVAAGLCGPAGQVTSYGSPRRGIMNYSGGALKTDGSEMLVFGGGGANAWAGNDVRALRLEDAAPAWRTAVPPSPASKLWPSTGAGRTAHTHLADGAPNSRHSYWQPQFVDGQDKFMTFGCQNVWETDTGTFNNVDAVSLATRKWDAESSHPPIPAARGYDGSWVCKDPRNDEVYASSARMIHKFVPSTNTWTTVFVNPGTGMDRGCAAIDTKRNLLLRIGMWGADNNRPLTLDLTTRQLAPATFSGPYAASIGATWSAGIVYDPGLDAFLFFRDDGFLYAIRYVSATEWSVDRLNVGGSAPTAGGSIVHSGGGCAIWGRMQYVPNLQGVCIIQRYDKPAYFIKTA